MRTAARQYLRRRTRRHHGEGGYTAVVTGIVLMVLMMFSAFAVDVANWHYTGARLQKAADASALAGVTKLPGDRTGAFDVARSYSSTNGFTNGLSSVTVTPSLDGSPTRLKVRVRTTVNNFFGPLMGVDATSIERYAVADFASPISMGSPCNEFGNDPDSTAATRAAACSGVSGQMWANINSPSSEKSNGDAFQSKQCTLSSPDGCASSVNTDYDANGYFYSIDVSASSTGPMKLQLFDPVAVNTGLACDVGFASSTSARNPWVTTSTDASARYDSGASSRYCTGDYVYGGTRTMETSFTLRAPSATPWDPASGSVLCQRTYGGYYSSSSDALYRVLNQASTSTYRADIAQNFRRWVDQCSFNAVAGRYTLEVKTNTGAADTSNAGNRFAMRAVTANLNGVSIAGLERMGIYSNKPDATTEFYLARVPSGAAGQVLNVRLFDIGDSTIAPTLQVVSPPDATGGSARNCTATGPTSGTLSTCSFSASTSTHNAKWQTISVPIPTTYSCDDSTFTKCWYRLRINYGGGAATSQPTDVTTWTANLQGDPIRLVE